MGAWVTYNGGWAVMLPMRAQMNSIPAPPYRSATPPPPQASVYATASASAAAPPGAQGVPGQYVFVQQAPATGWLMVPSGSWFYQPAVMSPP
jgi:hypothetical protein